MNAGRELDALIAEKVMEIPIALIHTDEDGRTIKTAIGNVLVKPCAAYSTDIAAAWMVVDRLIADGQDIEIINRDEGDQDRYWEIHLRDFCIEKKSLPETICVAALQLKEPS